MLRVMVVDDERDLEFLLVQKYRKQIRSEEIQLVFASDGVEALDRLRDEERIDIVLTDINMPRMDGLTLLSEIQELDVFLKVVIVSAYGDIDNIRTAMNRGAYDFLTKPIDFEDLRITLEKTQKEVVRIRDAFALQHQLTAIRGELDIASRIQKASLPSTFPAFPERDDFDLYATMIPAQEVGGDFYDFFLVEKNHLGFVIGDVSGKGLGAALYMSVTRTMLKATALQGLSPATCLTHVNRVLYPETMPKMFVTVVYGILNTNTGEVTYCNAGHHSPYVVSAGSGIYPLERTGGLGLCMLSEFEYHDKKTVLRPGDSLFLFSDGVTEAVNAGHDQFSQERLLACLHNDTSTEPDQMIRCVLQAIKSFTGDYPQFDDITMLALRYKSNTE